MEWKLIDVTLPRMEDKPKSLNTQRGPFIKPRSPESLKNIGESLSLK